MVPPTEADLPASLPPRGGPPGRRRWGRRGGLLLVGVLFGLIGGGFLLDEPAPRFDDLFLPPPTLAEPNPFASLRPGVPVSLDRLSDLFLRLELPARFPAELIREEVPRERLERWAGDPELTETLRAVREWASTFEASFTSRGGDPRAGVILRSTHVPRLTLDDGTAPTVGIGRRWQEPFPFEELLGKVSAAERALGAADDAVAHLTLALRLETWQIIHLPDHLNYRRVSRLLQQLRTWVESGALHTLRRPRVLEALRSWRLPPQAHRARLAELLRRRAETLADPEHWEVFFSDPPPSWRQKRHRTARRLADEVRRMVEAEGIPVAVPVPRTSPLVRAWIDPFGDRVLGAEYDYLHNLQEEWLKIREESELLRVALSIVHHERAHGSAPTTLDEVLAEAQLPAGAIPPRWDPTTRRLEPAGLPIGDGPATIRVLPLSVPAP